MRSTTLLLAAAGALALTACGPTVLERSISSPVPAGNAWAEYRVVSYDGVNRTRELWGVNRSDQRICISFSAYRGHLNAYEVGPRTEVKLLSLGQSGGDYATQIAYDMGGAACTTALFR